MWLEHCNGLGSDGGKTCKCPWRQSLSAVFLDRIPTCLSLTNKPTEEYWEHAEKQLCHTDEKYETGDKVYCKQADCPKKKEWAVVIGQDGAVVFVTHRGMWIRVHYLRLRRAYTENMEWYVNWDDTENDGLWARTEDSSQHRRHRHHTNDNTVTH